MTSSRGTTDDRTLVERATVRVLNAGTVSAKVDGEMLERIDARVAKVAAERGKFTRADVVRSALRLYLEAADAEDADELDVIDGTVIEG